MNCSSLIPIAVCAALGAEPQAVAADPIQPPNPGSMVAAPAVYARSGLGRRRHYRVRYHYRRQAPRVVVVRERGEVRVPAPEVARIPPTPAAGCDDNSPAAIVRAGFDELGADPRVIVLRTRRDP